MKRLAEWYPRLHPILGSVILVALFAIAGRVYTPSLLVVWPVAGLVVAWLTYKVGGWNDGDPLSGQVFLAGMIILLPPFGLAMLIADLREFNKPRRALGT